MGCAYSIARPTVCRIAPARRTNTGGTFRPEVKAPVSADPTAQLSENASIRIPAFNGEASLTAWNLWGSSMTSVVKGAPARRAFLYGSERVVDTKIEKGRLRGQVGFQYLQEHTHEDSVLCEFPREDGFTRRVFVANISLPHKKGNQKKPRKC